MTQIQIDSLVEVTTTVGTISDAEKIAHALIERRLAACVQITGPVTSVYRWQGAVHHDQEWRCTIKTTSALVDQIMLAIKEMHPYEVPEILCIPILKSHPDYERWLRESVSQ